MEVYPKVSNYEIRVFRVAGGDDGRAFGFVKGHVYVSFCRCQVFFNLASLLAEEGVVPDRQRVECLVNCRHC